MKKHIEDYNLTQVIFNTCGYQPEVELGKKNFKPQQMVGSLRNLSKLRCRCECGDFRHDPIIGRAKSKASARYPKELCRRYAELAVEHFKTMAKSEYLERRAKAMEIHLRKMKLRLREVEAGNKPSSSKGEEEERERTTEEVDNKRRDEGRREGEEGEEGGVEKGWIQGPGKFGVLKPSQAKKGEPSQRSYLGGMRNPAASVRSMPGLQNMGARIQRSWERLVRRKPEALELAANYGTQQ